MLFDAARIAICHRIGSLAIFAISTISAAMTAIAAITEIGGQACQGATYEPT
jgi:hypothetical protein